MFGLNVMKIIDILPVVYLAIGLPYPLSVTVNGLSSQELCSSKVCSGCIAGSLSCQEGGLTRLPDILSADIQSVIMIGHHFDIKFLSDRNFSKYSQQTQQLQRMTLRNCGIERLLPGAFRSLKALTQLDLSQNQIKTIESRTFGGLNLELLRLDENPGLNLAHEAFYDASIVSLSLNHCGLRSLAFTDLAPLFENKALANLHLSGNKLVTLENRLAPWFLPLQSLSLEQNPFVCDCRVRWLTDVLQQRLHRIRTRSLGDGGGYNAEFDNELLSSYFIEMSDEAQRAPLDEDLLKPVCRSPERLAGKLIEKLSHRDFYCDLPQLKTLEVDLSRDNKVSFDVNTLPSSPSSIKTNNIYGFQVSLRCEVRGSPEIQLSWYRRRTPGKRAYVGTQDSWEDIVKLTTNTIISPGVAEVYLTHPDPYISGDLVHSKLFEETGIVERLVCIANDVNGNTSAEVRLRWPNTLTPEVIVKEIHDVGVVQSKHMLAGLAKGVRAEPTLVTEQAATPTKARSRSEWYLLTGEDPSGFWLQKQFSTLQMVGAVAGTFICTLVLFIFGLLLLRIRHIHKTFYRSKIVLHECTQQHSLPTDLYATTGNYCSTNLPSSQSLAYHALKAPTTELASSRKAQLSYQSNPMTQFKENGSLSADFSQIRGRKYPAYEPVTGNDIQNTMHYSESITYDLPTLPSFKTTPGKPLPPVPVASNQMPITLATHEFEHLQPSMVNAFRGCAMNSAHMLNCSDFTPMTDNTTAADSITATLTRLRNSPLIHGHLPVHANRTLNRQSFISSLPISNNHFTFTNQSHLN